MIKIKVIVAGGREFNNYILLEAELKAFIGKENKGICEIVCGMARGADTLGKKFAKQYGLAIKYFPADWDTHGKSAGYRRNKQMAEYADSLIAFWDGKSKGTKHMIDLAKDCGLKFQVVRY